MTRQQNKNKKQHLKEKAFQATEKARYEAELVEYLLKSGWQKGKESCWFRVHWNSKGELRFRKLNNGFSYHTLRNAAKIQRKLDLNE